MILTKEKVLEEIAAGNIKIEPMPKPEQFGPGSVDLQLDNLFRVFKPSNEVLHVTNDVDAEVITEGVSIPEDGFILLKPGEAILGITREKVMLSPNISGRIEGRSRFARVGLAIHTTSGFAQPGSGNKVVLEITNIGPITLALHPGTLVCQFIFERCDGSAQYKGRYQGQLKP